jgi:hypothetical protein
MVDQGSVTKPIALDAPGDLEENMKSIFKLRVDMNDMLPSEDIIKINASNDGG